MATPDAETGTAAAAAGLDALRDWPPAERIKSVTAQTVRLPLRRPVSIASRHIRTRDFSIVTITADDGLEGIGYSYGGGLISEVVRRILRDVLLGRPAGAIEALWQAMYAQTLLLGRRGVVLRAISAVDIALWDVLAKRASLPLYRLLGPARTEVPAYFSGGYYREGSGVDDLKAEMRRAIDRGFDAVKIKVGGAPIAEDVERIAAAREVIGGQVRLAVDANNAWASAREALAAVRRMEFADLWWVEEPLSPDDIAGHAALAERLETPIATGEIEATSAGFAQLIAAGAADILQPDACVVGGVTEWMKIAHHAEAHGIEVAPHWNADIHVHLAAAASNCIGVEYFDVAEDVYNFDLVLAEHLMPKDSRIPVPNRPGIGVVLDPDAVRQYAVD
jgi:L-alanine-DL-glutamate epimerase-like enolase superfamily enzyme